VRRRLTGRVPVDYQRIHDNFRHQAHVQRLFVTAGLLSSLVPVSVCDPACGDASVVKVANTMRPIDWALLGDISAPAIEGIADGLGEMVTIAYNGDIAACIEAIADKAPRGRVDVIVLTETLEHMEDPDAILLLARQHADRLIASSPLMRLPNIDGNPEHLWQWDDEGYRQMLVDAGWEPESFASLRVFPTFYEFQLWGAR
jgi:2-polyprenyl-3-methyl-5-hydroxy-6-metoxy-1,4-benzoquinol methylase